MPLDKVQTYAPAAAAAFHGIAYPMSTGIDIIDYASSDQGEEEKAQSKADYQAHISLGCATAGG